MSRPFAFADSSLAKHSGECKNNANPQFVIVRCTDAEKRKTLFVKYGYTVECAGMKAMSDTTLRERLPDLRNQYNRLKSKEAKGNFLTRLQTAFPISRKLLIKRLSGNRPFKQRRGRGHDISVRHLRGRGLSVLVDGTRQMPPR